MADKAVEKTEKRRIILIEDNADHALLAKRSLERDGKMVVVNAATALDGLRQLKTGRYDVIICDYNLPDTSGLELLRQIKEENIQAPFIMLTGQGDERVAVNAMQAGAYNYVVKDDVYLTVLPRTVQETLDRFRADQERKRLQVEVWEKNRQLDEMNKELLRLDELKNQFVASVTHEFRTPLNAVQESLSLLIDGVVSPNTEKGREVLSIAKKNVVRVTALIDDLLDFSKFEAGKVRFDLKPCKLDDMISETVKSLEQLVQSHGLEIVFKESDIPEVVCDRKRIMQVLINLIGNAIKFTPRGGKVLIWAEKVLDDKVKVSIRDTGIGIDPKLHMKIFEKFEQVERSVPGSELKGTGLGLSICRHIIEQHHCSIWVEGELNKGSTFMFTLPTKPLS